jgi:hypothetical protein
MERSIRSENAMNARVQMGAPLGAHLFPRSAHSGAFHQRRCRFSRREEEGGRRRAATLKLFAFTEIAARPQSAYSRPISASNASAARLR